MLSYVDALHPVCVPLFSSFSARVHISPLLSFRVICSWVLSGASVQNVVPVSRLFSGWSVYLLEI